MFKKNVAGQFFHFQGVDATTGGIKAGVSWTVRRCIDGTFAAAGGTATEDGSTGWYKFALTDADTNGNNIGFNFTGTGAVPQTINILTDGAPPDVNAVKFSGQTITAAAGVTLPSSVASPTNITAAAGCAVTAIGNDVITAASINTGALTADAFAADALIAATFATDAISADALATDAITEIQTGLATSTALADVPTVAEFEARTLVAADYVVVGDTLAAVTAVATTTTLTNLPAATADWLDAAAVKADAVTKIQNGLATSTSIGALNDLSAAAVNAEVVDVLRTDTIPDSVAADGAAPTIVEALYEILQFLTEKNVIGTTLTVKKPDGSTGLMTFTLDNAINPTAITRTT